jgi:predicted nucleic acid-binding protein
MSEAVCDTGPILHLWEIGRTNALKIFSKVLIPALVADELSRYEVRLSKVSGGSALEVVVVDEVARRELLVSYGASEIHPADAEVVALARSLHYGVPVLTDDLTLRRRLEAEGAVVVGSVGILVRAYRKSLLSRSEVEVAVQALLSRSTLRMSSAFRTYIRSLMAELL